MITTADFATRYAAVHSRDARFDGQFVTAVRSTGIYCRPSCPARTPKPENCTFYLTSAAAHQAGYRACRRCLPEATPGSPAWNLRQDVAARAMRLIGEGVIDREGVPGLAARLGYSSRQLGRILGDELGAGPLALARAQRAQTARHLLVSSGMTVADVAHAAGFSSIRQFNDTVREVFGMTPGALRARARRTERSADVGAGGLTLRLPVRAPFDGAGVIAWLAGRAIPGVEHAGDDGYVRSMRLANGPSVVTLRPRDHEVEMSVRLTDLADLAEAIARVRRLLDLDADPEAVDAALAALPAVAPSVAAVPGIRIPGAVDAAEILVRAIAGQQVTVAAARNAVSKVAAFWGEALPASLATDTVTQVFPDAAVLAAHASETLTGPRRRRAAVATAAAAVAGGDLILDASRPVAQATADLEALPGIGPWTSHYVALRLLGATDVLLTGDVAVRAGARQLGLPADPRGLTAATSTAAPWRSYLMMHLWRAASPHRTDDAHAPA
ncbi:DNA-3-methyladenine glycosylase 2 family protein [Demequina sp. NBRC 110055]|uniref:DNA-3-methyladenine glycosylase 2 family protein n=1 Tax=Demequina sp. NBRC 110055 TaxID=1570344 RepID=UPI000A02C4FC|nr:AlkA N-terminal domain-containing protein [Demequina sp. NBRC 110055]